MKKFIILVVLFITAFTVIAVHAKDKTIKFRQLPENAQAFIKAHFSKDKIELILFDDDIFDKDYEVRMMNGAKVEFDSKGNWTEVSDKQGIPNTAIPQAIRDYVGDNEFARPVVKISRDKWGYEIKSSKGVEIKFNNKFKVVEVDD